MAEIECPYCRYTYELDADDSRGIEENIPHEEQCPACDNWFTFTTEIVFNHRTQRSGCLNGRKHKLSFEKELPVCENLKFRCKKCDSLFGTETHPVLKNMFFNGEASSDFKFNKSLFKQIARVISHIDFSYKYALHSYIFWFGNNCASPVLKNHYHKISDIQLKILLETTETKETIMRAFAKLFPDECADIYRC